MAKIFGRDIIREVAHKVGIPVTDILGKSQRAHLVDARIEIICRLKDLKFSNSQIGRLLQRNRSTIAYHTNLALRTRSNNRARVAMTMSRLQERQDKAAKLLSFQDYIASVCREHGFRPEEVCRRGRGRSAAITQLRAKLIHDLKGAMKPIQISRLLGLDHSSILYHLSAERRERTRERSRIAWANRLVAQEARP